MVGEEILELPIELIGRIEFLVTILQTVGWVIIIYIVFNIINALINQKRNKKIDEVLSTLGEIKEVMKEQKEIMKKK